MAWNEFWHFFTIFDHFGLGIDACSTITEFAKKRWQIVPEKGIFHPFHNDKNTIWDGGSNAQIIGFLGLTDLTIEMRLGLNCV